jgi:hypothetical protein
MDGAYRRPITRNLVTVAGKTATLSKDAGRAGPSFAQARLDWRPSALIAPDLPPGFCHSFNCLTRSDGFRAFAPSAGVGTFLVEANLSGSVLLTHQASLDHEHRFSYRAMRLIYQLAPRLREHFSGSFEKEKDLYLPRVGRIGDGHILPESPRNEPPGDARSWGPAKMVEQGRKKAIEAGCHNPDPGTCIRLGLLEAAKRDPLDTDNLSEEDALKIVRLALFDLGPSPKMNEAALEKVTSRLLQALGGHLQDDSEAFNRWFFENLDNLVHQMAKKKRPDGIMARDVVRQAVLELVFRAHTYVGDCVSVLMEDFRRALPRKLSHEEQLHFAALYEKQPSLGGLPLIMLYERFGFLREAICELLEDPRDRKRPGVLLRLLVYYGEMVSSKRAGERQYKKQRQHRNSKNRTAQVWSLVPEHDQITTNAMTLFAGVAAELREWRGATCPCGSTRDWRAELMEEETNSDMIVMRDLCERCNHEETLGVTRWRFEQIAKRLIGESDEVTR